MAALRARGDMFFMLLPFHYLLLRGVFAPPNFSALS
jgi:hypothetical protein